MDEDCCKGYGDIGFCESIPKIQYGRQTSKSNKILNWAYDRFNSSWHVRFEQDLLNSIRYINCQNFDLQ